MRPNKRLDWLEETPLMLGHGHTFPADRKATVTLDQLRPNLPDDCCAVLSWDEDIRAGEVRVTYLKKP